MANQLFLQRRRWSCYSKSKAERLLSLSHQSGPKAGIRTITIFLFWEGVFRQRQSLTHSLYQESRHVSIPFQETSGTSTFEMVTCKFLFLQGICDIRTDGSSQEHTVGWTRFWRLTMWAWVWGLAVGCFIFHHLKGKAKAIWHMMLLYILRLLPQNQNIWMLFGLKPKNAT